MMKLAAFTLLATTAHGAAHLAQCTKGCARNSCAQADKDAIIAIDTLLAKNTAEGTGAKKKHAAVAQGSAVHVPFICKAKSSGKRRDLAAHVQLTLRVAVAGVDGSTTNLDNMKKADHIDYIQVVDATAANHGRALAGHAKTLMYAKGWETTEAALKGQNACFEFDLLKADKVTKIKAASHSTTAGLYSSTGIDVSALPDCVETMASASDHRRQLAGHAGKCVRIENGASPCPEPKSPSPAADTDSPAPAPAKTSSATTYSVVTAAVVGVLAMFL